MATETIGCAEWLVVHGTICHTALPNITYHGMMPEFALQGLIHRGMGAGDVQQGWDVAVTPTHIAVTLPTQATAVYEFQARSVNQTSNPVKHMHQPCTGIAALCAASSVIVTQG